MLLSLRIYVWFHTALSAVVDRVRRDDRGQATSEYALVLLGAAAVAILVIGWATKTNKIGGLLDKVFDSVTGKIK
jgi:Flp pilus assembly pilin Flp